MTDPKGNSEFCFPRISILPKTKSRETLRFEGNKIHCSPRGQSLSDLLYTPNANMADHSVGARDELHESEASEASVFCFDNASP